MASNGIDQKRESRNEEIAENQLHTERDNRLNTDDNFIERDQMDPRLIREDSQDIRIDLRPSINEDNPNPKDKNKSPAKADEVATDDVKFQGPSPTKDAQRQSIVPQEMNSGPFKDNQNSDLSEIVEEEDASDLVYAKELKLLLEDHKRVTKLTMILAIAVLLG